MSTGENPFKPGFGKTPPVIAGRDTEMSILQKAMDALVPGAKSGPNEIVYCRHDGPLAWVLRLRQEAGAKAPGRRNRFSSRQGRGEPRLGRDGTGHKPVPYSSRLAGLA